MFVRSTALLLLVMMVAPSCVQGPSVTEPSHVEPVYALALDEAGFDSLVITTPGVAMVDFYMPTCPACVAMDQIVDTLAVLFDGKALVGKYNTTIDFSLPRLYGVQYVPTFIFFRNGSEYHRHTGVESRESLAAWIQMGLDAEDNPGGDG